MPRCYLCALSWNSSIDRDTNNMSIFHLIEHTQLRTSDVPGFLPFQVHHYWEFEESERGQDYQFRTVVIRPSKDRWESEPYDSRSRAPRNRLRATGIRVLGAGIHLVTAESRATGTEDWSPAGLAWPLQVDLLPDTTPT